MLLIGLVAAATAATSAYDVLKMRDAVGCDALGDAPGLRDELLALAEGDVAPPYVPMRAATCGTSCPPSMSWPRTSLMIGES